MWISSKRPEKHGILLPSGAIRQEGGGVRVLKPEPPFVIIFEKSIESFNLCLTKGVDFLKYAPAFSESVVDPVRKRKVFEPFETG